jgi:hypothetical protein
MAEYNNHLPCAPMVTGAEVISCCQKAIDNGFTATSPEVLDAIEDASSLLYFLTGRQFGGTCSQTIRPCVTCESGCSNCCCGVRGIDLGLWPVTEIVRVRMDGVDQPVADYHIDEWHYLVPNDREQLFPNCNNMNSVAGDANDNELEGNKFVFEIEVNYGMAVPRMMTRAARDLACELLSGCPTATCDLPDLVTSVNRRGITVDTINPLDMLTEGRTGIYSCDIAIMTYNPSKLQSPSFVWSPDLERNKNRRTHT